MELLTLVAYAVAGFLAGTALSITISVVMRFVVRRRKGLAFVSRRLKVPQRVLLTLGGTGLGVAMATADPEPAWRPLFMQGFLIVIILASAYLGTGVIKAVEDAIVAGARALAGRRCRRGVRLAGSDESRRSLAPPGDASCRPKHFWGPPSPALRVARRPNPASR